MRLKRMYVRNFRCFGPTWTEIQFDDLTCLVGANGCGKTSALQALARMFGPDNQRRFVREDFHLPSGTDPEAVAKASLNIEVDIEFDDTEADNELSTEFWQNLVVEAAGQAPLVRFYLQADWVRTNTPEGTAEAQLFMVQVSRDPTAPEPKEEDLQRVPAEIRSRIQVHYVPATRDPMQELRSQGAGNLHRLIQALIWQTAQKNAVETSSKALSDELRKHSGLSAIEGHVTKAWRGLHTQPTYELIRLQPVPTRFEDVLRQIEPNLHSNDLGRSTSVRELSDGQRSLFHLGLVRAVQEVHSQVLQDAELRKAVSSEDLGIAHLSIMAIEEPENHLSPHYLGRVMNGMRALAKSPRTQLVITSHSASILGRIDPNEVRHFRLGPDRIAKVTTIDLPPQPEASKFVRGAVRAFPELYFAELVILGEGDSEETVLPPLLALGAVEADAALISVVPLGGRHVNHLWRLLDQLAIPFLTLIDRDDGRGGGGWKRIKYVIDQLGSLAQAPQVSVVNIQGEVVPVTADVMAAISADGTGLNLEATTVELRKHGVYLSAPLDLDWLMYKAFPAAYRASARGNPDMPAGVNATLDGDAVAAVLGPSTRTPPPTLNTAQREDWYWYRYLFLTRSKPATHLMALETLREGNLQTQGWPEPLQALLEAVRTRVAVAQTQDQAVQPQEAVLALDGPPQP